MKLAFRVPEHLIIKETEYWTVNHRVDSALPCYLIVGSLFETTNLFDLPVPALSELGPLLASIQKALMDFLHPDHIYLGRYGHQGHSIHFHAIPIYSWVKKAFSSNSRYGVLKSFYKQGVPNSDYDGVELTLDVERVLRK